MFMLKLFPNFLDKRDSSIDGALDSVERPNSCHFKYKSEKNSLSNHNFLILKALL